MIRQLIDVAIPMRDGVCLSADIRLPDGPGPFPVLVLRTPYGSADPTGYRHYLDVGYAVVEQDCRGRFDSDGRFRPFVEVEDGFDTLAWVRAQEWCDGRLGMFGGSYLGFTQLAAAQGRPVGLRTIMPQVIGHDLFKELVYTDGVLNLELAVSWSFHTAGRCRQENATTDWWRTYRYLPLNGVVGEAGYRLPHFDEWLAHPVYDEFWRERSFETHYRDFDLPALHIGGWYDGFLNGLLRNFNGMREHGGPGARNRQKLLVGPWGHEVNTRRVGQLDFGPQAVVNLVDLTDRWLARWVLDEPNGIENEAPVRFFVMGSNIWRDAQTWPPAGVREQAWYLHGNGRANSLYGDGVLDRHPASAGKPDTYIYDPDNPVPTLGGGVLGPNVGPNDHAPIERRDDVLVFTGPELREPLEVVGPVSAVVFASSSAPDTDFIVRLCDVHPDGRSMIICDGILRIRFREGLDREVLLEPGSIAELRIALGNTANTFLSGHRLRLEITSSCFPRFARNLNTGEPVSGGIRCQRAVQTLHHDSIYPSRLIMSTVQFAAD